MFLRPFWSLRSHQWEHEELLSAAPAYAHLLERIFDVSGRLGRIFGSMSVRASPVDGKSNLTVKKRPAVESMKMYSTMTMATAILFLLFSASNTDIIHGSISIIFVAIAAVATPSAIDTADRIGLPPTPSSRHKHGRDTFDTDDARPRKRRRTDAYERRDEIALSALLRVEASTATYWRMHLAKKGVAARRDEVANNGCSTDMADERTKEYFALVEQMANLSLSDRTGTDVMSLVRVEHLTDDGPDTITVETVTSEESDDPRNGCVRCFCHRNVSWTIETVAADLVLLRENRCGRAIRRVISVADTSLGVERSSCEVADGSTEAN